jgi:hypothetical protein
MVPSGDVCWHARRLVDHHQVLVFKQDMQGDGLRERLAPTAREGEGDLGVTREQNTRG